MCGWTGCRCVHKYSPELVRSNSEVAVCIMGIVVNYVEAKASPCLFTTHQDVQFFRTCPNGENNVVQGSCNRPKSPHSFRAPNSLRDRSALLGGLTPPASGRSSPFELPLHASSGQRYVDDLEGQNDEQLEGLSAKVKLLKDVSATSHATAFLLIPGTHPSIKITIGIGNEVRESTVQLSHMVRCRCRPLFLG